MSTHDIREGNNVLHEAVLKEAKHSVNIILRLIEKSGEQEVGGDEMRKAQLSAHFPTIQTVRQSCEAVPDCAGKLNSKASKQKYIFTEAKTLNFNHMRRSPKPYIQTIPGA